MGGGVMRAAAKVASASGIRGLAADHHPLSSAVRRAGSVRPAAATLEDVKLTASNSDVSNTKSCTEMDDWVFAGEDVVSVTDAVPMPRVIFGGVPTLHEAEEATSELSAALEKDYLSSPSEDSVSTVEKDVVGLSLLTTQHLESTVTALPSPAVMAFRFLTENPAAKNVVSSIASDPNVWNAVLQNQEFQGYLLSQRACLSSTGMNLEAYPVSHGNQSVTNGDHRSESQESHEDFFMKIKNLMFGMFSRFSDYFKNLFGGKAAFTNADASWANYEDAFKVFGLAAVVILVIVLKRG